jgi:hypothetical protein
MIKTLDIDKGKGTTLTGEVSWIIHGIIFQQVHMNKRKILPTTRTHASR